MIELKFQKPIVKAGMDDFLTKPIEHNKVTSTLQHWLNKVN